MRKQRLRQVWRKLDVQRSGPLPCVRRIHIDRLQGIRDLRVTFGYPVSVLAGKSGSGKSTLLFAAACALTNPGEDAPAHTPVSLFRQCEQHIIDTRGIPEHSEFHVDCSTRDRDARVSWKLISGQWKRTVETIPDNAKLPKRRCYLRTPTEELETMQTRRGSEDVQPSGTRQPRKVMAEEVYFVHRLLPHLSVEDLYRFLGMTHDVWALPGAGTPDCSGLTMGKGEQTVLRLAMELLGLRDAVVLIDDVEAGLHPQAQELLMLTLQELALQNNWQVIVSTNSSVVLNCVPPAGRRFLERAEANSVCVGPYPDFVQRALYDPPARGFSLVCGDEAAEAVLTGVLHSLIPREGWPLGKVEVVREGEPSEFPTYARLLRKCEALNSFAFVLDGEQKGKAVEKSLQQMTRQPVIFLPGESPEEWVWDRLLADPEHYANLFDVAVNEFHTALVDAQGAITDDGRYSPAERCKRLLSLLSNSMPKSTADICMTVGREEGDRSVGEVREFAHGVRQAFNNWCLTQHPWYH